MTSRLELARYFNKLGFKKGAEIGVAGGSYSETLCQSIPRLTLYCIDIWQPYHGNRRGGYRQQHNNNFELAQKRLAQYNTKLIRAMSMDAVKDFADGSLDFVFIDSNHDFDYVMEDLIEWTKKVRPGGIVSGHDYHPIRNGGVIEAVDAYTNAHGIKLNLTRPTPDNVWDDTQPSWYFFKT